MCVFRFIILKNIKKKTTSCECAVFSEATLGKIFVLSLKTSRDSFLTTTELFLSGLEFAQDEILGDP